MTIQFLQLLAGQSFPRAWVQYMAKKVTFVVSWQLDRKFGSVATFSHLESPLA